MQTALNSIPTYQRPAEKKKTTFFLPDFRPAVRIHIICWLAYIGIEILYLIYAGAKLEPAYVYILFYAINIAYFYGFVFLLSKSIGIRKIQWLHGLAGLLGLFAAYSFCKFIADFLVYPTGAEGPAAILKLFPSSIFRALHFSILATFYWSASHIRSYREAAETAEKQELIALKEKAELQAKYFSAENARLQQQINPHLLFNTLNFIYNSVYRTSPETAKAVWLLSDLMRFGLESASSEDAVLVEDEIIQIRQLIDINAIRYGRPPAFEFSVEISGKDHRVIPLVLLTLTENIFKHGDLQQAQSPAVLSISVNSDHILVFHSKNLKKSSPGHRRHRQLGLEHTKLRLEMSYPERHLLTLNEDEKYFELNLRIEL